MEQDTESNTFKAKNTQTCHLSGITLQTEAEWSQIQGQPLLQNKIVSNYKANKKKSHTKKLRSDDLFLQRSQKALRAGQAHLEWAHLGWVATYVDRQTS